MLVYLKQTFPERRPHAAYTITDMIGRFTRYTWRRYSRWNRNRIALQLLCSLDDRMLKDIGITRTLLKFSIKQGASQATGALQNHARRRCCYEV